MPEMSFFRNSRAPGNSTIKGGATFTGDVFIDFVHRDDSMSIANVMFTPCARTYWHTHENGQILRVLAGSGWICDKGGEPQKLNVGDMVVCPPGTTHWHGGDDGSYMVHLAISQGKAEWHDEVTGDEYGKKK